MQGGPGDSGFRVQGLGLRGLRVERRTLYRLCKAYKAFIIYGIFMDCKREHLGIVEGVSIYI